MNTYQEKGSKRKREREREKIQQKQSNDFSIEHHSDCNITKERKYSSSSSSSGGLLS
jgi:hypothetical protein